MDWLSVVPPIVAIVVVVWRKEVIIALLLAIFTAELLQLAAHWYAPGLAAIHTIDRIVGVFASPDNARLLVFSLVIGALMAYMRLSGGVAALVESFLNRGLAKNARQASLLTSGVGAAIFVESNLSVLTVGSCREACSTGTDSAAQNSPTSSIARPRPCASCCY